MAEKHCEETAESQENRRTQQREGAKQVKERASQRTNKKKKAREREQEKESNRKRKRERDGASLLSLAHSLCCVFCPSVIHP